MSKSIFALVTASLLVLSGLGCSQQGVDESLITVYSERKEHLIKPLFEEYTAKTGIRIRYITDNAGPLISRLENEREATPADMFITVDAGSLWQASERGLLRPIDSETLKENVPVHLRADNNEWFGLSVRARTIIHTTDTDRVDLDDLSTYEALADPKWRDRVCLRTSKKVYNQSLVATMINALGVEETEEVVKGWVANLATPPYSNDTVTMEAIVAGQCDVSLVNTYYFGRLQRDKPDVPLALFWPNQDGRGVHINVSGAGITKHAKNPDEAQKLLEWLASESAQYRFAELNLEYPVHAAVEPSPIVAAWGEFKADVDNVEATGRLQAEAVRLMDRAGYR